MNFDVQVQTAPDIQFQSALTQDLQVEASLRLRGNPTNPGIVGRINITQGQLVLFGTRYNINQGSVAFYNPLEDRPDSGHRFGDAGARDRRDADGVGAAE